MWRANFADSLGEHAAASPRLPISVSSTYRRLWRAPHNRRYLRKRLAWRIQELAEGGLPASALERIAQLGDDVPERWRMRQAAQVQDLGTVQPIEPRDPRVPPVGTVLRRVFNGVAHEVTVCSEGFEHGGERFKTLSAVAKHITGTPWNGFLFFGLKKRVETTSEESAA
ncbi:MAG: DUF2924 domain-containing protein [Polyangiaceae bacterium]|nr:DUF2924 domain-containing protein [Polyangiaceae bacterium]